MGAPAAVPVCRRAATLDASAGQARRSIPSMTRGPTHGLSAAISASGLSRSRAVGLASAASIEPARAKRREHFPGEHPTAFSRLSSVHTVDLEGQQRVRFDPFPEPSTNGRYLREAEVQGL